MLGRLIRMLLALTAMSPLAISLAISFVHENELRYAFIAFCFCILLGLIAWWLISQARHRLEILPVRIKKVKSADKEIMAFFVAYVLPLIFRSQLNVDIWAWGWAAVILLFVLWSTHAIQANPVLGVLGFHFYDVETDDGVAYLLISRGKINSALSVTKVVQIGEYGLVEAAARA